MIPGRISEQLMPFRHRHTGEAVGACVMDDYFMHVDWPDGPAVGQSFKMRFRDFFALYEWNGWTTVAGYMVGQVIDAETFTHGAPGTAGAIE